MPFVNEILFRYTINFGLNVTAVADNTMHVECLNAVNTPAAFGFAPPGTIMWKNIAAILPTDKVLVIA